MHPYVKAQKTLEYTFGHMMYRSLPICLADVAKALIDITEFDDFVYLDFELDRLSSKTPQFEGKFNRKKTKDGKIVGLVYVPSDVDQYTRNIIAAKELMHAFDPVTQRSASSDELDLLIQALTLDPMLWNLDETTSSFSDIFGPYAAIELLVPYDARQWLYHGKSVEYLSDLFEVPQSIINTTLSDEYSKYADKWREQLGFESIVTVDGSY